MEFWGYFKRHMLSSLMLAVSAAVSVIGLILDLLEVSQLPWLWKLAHVSGLSVFFLLTIASLARSDARQKKEDISKQDSVSAPQSAVLDFTLHGVGKLVRHPEGSQNIEEAFAMYAAFEAESDRQYRFNSAALENPELGNQRAWYICVMFAQAFEAREVQIKDIHPLNEIDCSPNRRSQKFMLVRCEGLKIGTRAKLLITRETGVG